MAAHHIASHSLPIEEKRPSSPSTPSKASDDQDVEAAAIPQQFPDEGQPPRDIYGWKWGLAGNSYSHPEKASC